MSTYWMVMLAVVLKYASKLHALFILECRESSNIVSEKVRHEMITRRDKDFTFLLWEIKFSCFFYFLDTENL